MLLLNSVSAHLAEEKKEVEAEKEIRCKRGRRLMLANDIRSVLGCPPASLNNAVEEGFNNQANV